MNTLITTLLLSFTVILLVIAGMSIGVAPERNRNGGAGLRAALSLLALTGNIGPRGAGPCDVSRYFPTDAAALERAIALARVPVDAEGACEVEIRGKSYPARLVKPPFVRHGAVCDGVL